VAVIGVLVGALVAGVLLIALGSSGSRTSCLKAGDASIDLRITEDGCKAGELCIVQDPAVGADKLKVTTACN
jgi:hypothetical protein